MIGTINSAVEDIEPIRKKVDLLVNKFFPRLKGKWVLLVTDGESRATVCIPSEVKIDTWRVDEVVNIVDTARLVLFRPFLVVNDRIEECLTDEKVPEGNMS